MSNSNVPPALSQVNSLTKRQKQIIDDFIEQHPETAPSDVGGFYSHHCYARNWHITLAIYPENGNIPDAWQVITRCDWKHTAQAKVDQIRAYIASKQGGVE